ncbi:unnamed protein product [Musa acuminata subsp. malaccensis]|uniref:(wild Malaysian banana) hypothetical protein n=1 Tax=Musa acuminata subsp. malaccensis TaxID=214687 RepID=A0A8D7BC70_MUSAM|nr:unnamed protein product [Musa acuminata subsp. malaccensis]
MTLFIKVSTSTMKNRMPIFPSIVGLWMDGCQHSTMCKLDARDHLTSLYFQLRFRDPLLDSQDMDCIQI